MEARNFEYAALKAMAQFVFSAKVCNRIEEYARETGLAIAENTGDRLVVYPARSTRKNPACIVITTQSDLCGWSCAREWGQTHIYIYEAGNYDMAKGREKAQVRTKKKSGPLWAGSDSIHKQLGKRGISALL